MDSESCFLNSSMFDSTNFLEINFEIFSPSTMKVFLRKNTSPDLFLPFNINLVLSMDANSFLWEYSVIYWMISTDKLLALSTSLICLPLIANFLFLFS